MNGSSKTNNHQSVPISFKIYGLGTNFKNLEGQNCPQQPVYALATLQSLIEIRDLPFIY